jgi:hypothetical protein
VQFALLVVKSFFEIPRSRILTHRVMNIPVNASDLLHADSKRKLFFDSQSCRIRHLRCLVIPMECFSRFSVLSEVFGFGSSKGSLLESQPEA